MAIWNVDPAHTVVGFSVRHMMVTNVRGSFLGVEGTFDGDADNIAGGKISFKIDTDSITTNNEDRDNHLRSEDFFDAAKHEHILFTSTEIVEAGKDKFDVTGDLTVKDVTKKMTFKVERTGAGKNPWGVDVVGFEADGKISRKEFGLTWNQTLETGGVLVGDDIKISIELQMNPA